MTSVNHIIKEISSPSNCKNQPEEKPSPKETSHLVSSKRNTETEADIALNVPRSLSEPFPFFHTVYYLH